MKFVNNFKEYKENWCDLGTSYQYTVTHCDTLSASIVFVSLTLWALPCCILGVWCPDED
jgi:hypothetical protein